MKYRIIYTTKNGVTENLPCNNKYEAWCMFHWHLNWQRANNEAGSTFLLADNVVIMEAGSKLEINEALKYLGMKKPSMIKRLVVKLYYKIVYLF